ncbi:MAG: hypothetical protein KC912_21660, partial [Proteobacteria bacterium]|nr:hypothetical protein [Pseudomonadota bacterium]
SDVCSSDLMSPFVDLLAPALSDAVDLQIPGDVELVFELQELMSRGPLQGENLEHLRPSCAFATVDRRPVSGSQ